MNFQKWQKRRNAIQIHSKDILTVGQPIIIDHRRGATSDAKIHQIKIDTQGKRHIAIDAIFPIKTIRRPIKNEILYRTINTLDLKRGKEAIIIFKAVLQALSNHLTPEKTTSYKEISAQISKLRL